MTERLSLLIGLWMLFRALVTTGEVRVFVEAGGGVLGLDGWGGMGSGVGTVMGFGVVWAGGMWA